MNRSLQIILSLIVAVVSFLFFLILFFPLDALINHELADIESQTKGMYRVSVSEMDTSLLFDSKFKNFRIEKKEQGGFQELFSAPEVRVGISLASLLSQRLNLRFLASFKAGSFGGRIILSRSESVFDLEFDKMSLEELVILKSYFQFKDLQFQLKGFLDGTVYFSESQDSGLSGVESNFNIKVSNFRITDFNSKLAGKSIFFQNLVLSPEESYAVFEGDLEKERFSLTNISIPGPDIEFYLNGRLRLNEKAEVLQSKMTGRFALAETLFQKIPELELLNEYKNADGFFPLRISGSFRNLPQIRIGNLNLTQILKTFGLVN